MAQRLFVEPVPLLADQFQFPALVITRKRDVWTRKTAVWDHDASEWEVSYVLPPLTPKARRSLEPILRAAAVVIEHAIGNLNTTGIERARITDIRYGGYEAVSQNTDYYRAIFGTIEVLELNALDVRNSAAFDGADATVDQKERDGTSGGLTIALQTKPAPTLTSIALTTGTKAGGVSVSLTGTGFMVGTTPRVQIGNAAATNVVVLSSTLVTCVTPAHAAYPTFAADVTITNADGQSATLTAAYTFTTP